MPLRKAQNRGMSTYLKLGVGLSLLGLLVLSGWIAHHRMAHNPVVEPGPSWGLDELAKGNLTLYVSQLGIYRLDAGRARWTLVRSCYSGHTEQDVAIRDGQAYYRAPDGIYTVSIIGGDDAPALLSKIAFSPDTLAVSWDGRFIAYRKYLDEAFRHHAVVVRYLQSGDEKSLPVDVAPQSICWSGDDKALVMSCDGRIVRLVLASGNLETVCEGYSAQILRDGSLCYHRTTDMKGERDILFLRRDMVTGNEKELARVPVAGFQVAALDAEGKFLAVGYMVRRRLISFDFATAVELIDLETGNRCWLPPFDKVTRCIIWQSSRKPDENAGGKEK